MLLYFYGERRTIFKLHHTGWYGGFLIPPDEECHLKNWSALYYGIDTNEETGYKMGKEMFGRGIRKL